MPHCFIVMPISVPQQLIPSCYSDDAHFKRILDHLFIPAVKAAGYDPLPPITKGGEVIIAEIINHLAKADMVLCDISSHNPNVFYELGIRTALDQPVTIVRDNHTKKIPFDTAAINIEEYTSDLRPWSIDSEIARIAQHLKDSASKANGRNSVWRYFGVSAHGAFSPETSTNGDKLDVILSAIKHMGMDKSDAQFARTPESLWPSIGNFVDSGSASDLVGKQVIIDGKEITILGVDTKRGTITVRLEKGLRGLKLSDPAIRALWIVPFSKSPWDSP